MAPKKFFDQVLEEGLSGTFVFFSFLHVILFVCIFIITKLGGKQLVSKSRRVSVVVVFVFVFLCVFCVSVFYLNQVGREAVSKQVEEGVC